MFLSVSLCFLIFEKGFPKTSLAVQQLQLPLPPIAGLKLCPSTLSFIIFISLHKLEWNKLINLYWNLSSGGVMGSRKASVFPQRLVQNSHSGHENHKKIFTALLWKLWEISSSYYCWPSQNSWQEGDILSTRWQTQFGIQNLSLLWQFTTWKYTVHYTTHYNQMPQKSRPNKNAEQIRAAVRVGSVDAARTGGAVTEREGVLRRVEGS